MHPKYPQKKSTLLFCEEIGVDAVHHLDIQTFWRKCHWNVEMLEKDFIFHAFFYVYFLSFFPLTIKRFLLSLMSHHYWNSQYLKWVFQRWYFEIKCLLVQNIYIFKYYKCIIFSVFVFYDFISLNVYLFNTQIFKYYSWILFNFFSTSFWCANHYSKLQ